jgi:hypothetical protein
LLRLVFDTAALRFRSERDCAESQSQRYQWNLKAIDPLTLS